MSQCHHQWFRNTSEMKWYQCNLKFAGIGAGNYPFSSAKGSLQSGKQRRGTVTAIGNEKINIS